MRFALWKDVLPQCVECIGERQMLIMKFSKILMMIMKFSKMYSSGNILKVMIIYFK